ncbi:Methyltransferase type 11 [Nitrospina gracilis 3/211]|uniref:Methyltransferase type 11 n=1 Tax=Nitrospina gracilis (strain 3/211) TaxID=1266370 RepID=M1ZB32_NITG3|nr:class I SAM-dependent methyltransferase [Nitrospina gracilis]CCQ90507.1 Methyltransferase type 11 [Nitrospina gracilis 3/211]
MGFYEEHILPRGIDWVLSGKRFHAVRERAVTGARGAVLEVGLGSGLNLPFYPDAVEKLYALDPSRVARKLATRRIRRAPFPVEFAALKENGVIDLPDQSVDAVVTTFTLCTIPDAPAALKEFQRVLKPGGVYHFLEHGRDPDPDIARWQDRWNPIQKCIAGGCHVNRPIAKLIEDSGFTLHECENFYLDGPKLFTYMYGGKAVVGGTV